MSTSDIYAELPPSLRKKLLPAGIASSATPKQQLLQQPTAGPSRELTALVPPVARASVPSKLSQRPLTLSNPAKESDRTVQEKEKARLERKKQKIANKRRRSGRLVKADLGRLPPGGLPSSRPLLKGQASYELLRPLHKLWLGYISELLNLSLRTEDLAPGHAEGATSSNEGVGNSSMPVDPPVPVEAAPTEAPQALPSEMFSIHQMQTWQGKLVKADFHGCSIEVIKAKHPSLIGLAGIVAQETEGTFRIVTANNVVKVVPKPNVSFAFSLPLPADHNGKLRDIRFELHGSNFAFRGADRASRKFKAKGAKGLDF